MEKYFYKWVNGVEQQQCRCIIKSDRYLHNFAFVKQLVAIAQSDFPELKDEDIDVVKFNGDHWKHLMGIEFSPPREPDSSYQVVDGSPEPLF